MLRTNLFPIFARCTSPQARRRQDAANSFSKSYTSYLFLLHTSETLKMNRAPESWQSKVEKKRKDILSKIPPQWRLSQGSIQEGGELEKLVGPWFEAQHPNDREREIAQLSLPMLFQAMQSRTVSAREVANVFGRRAAIASQSVSHPCVPRNSSNEHSPTASLICVWTKR